MKRLKGPQLRMPDLKPPAFLADLYYDLRDRRLLPLVALVLVAILATPILLAQKRESTPPPVGTGAIAALRAAGGGRTAKLTVVEAKPGLREYRRRLHGRSPTDPFRKDTVKPSLKGARLGGGGEGSSGSSSATTTSTSTTVKEAGGTKTTKTTTETTTNGSGEGRGGGEVGGKHPPVTLYTFAVDLTIVHSSGSEAGGDRKSDPPETRKRVLPTTVLPGEKTQVVTYMGLSGKTKKPYFLVSPQVTGVFGEGKCASGTDVCQLIELETGLPEVFEYGEGGDRYSIKVTKVEFVSTGHL
jgi:hypothetical protein